MIVREKTLSAPAVKRPISGILDHATVVDVAEFGWRNNDGLFQTWNCLDTLVPTTLCPEVPGTKEFGEGQWAAGFEFAVQGGVLCRLVGYDWSTPGGLRDVFEMNETRGVERALLGTRFVDNGSGEDQVWAAAQDLTPAGVAVSPRVGLAILEGFAGQVYSGAPTIHAPRTVASYLAASHDVTEDDDLLWTRLGSKFVNGAGYEPSTGPDGQAPAAGEFWLYASGEVFVERGEVISREGTDWVSNEEYALAERMYRVAVDCFTAAVRVEVY